MGRGITADWVCGLCCGCILYGCNDAVLVTCLGLTQIKDDFAEFLLPYVIYDAVAKGTRDGQALHVFSKFFQKILDNHWRYPRRSIQLLLRVLNYLRQMRTTDMIHTNQNSLGGSSQVPSLPAAMFYVTVDFLSAARAALSCHAYFTALLYLEFHNEHIHGDLIPDTSAEATQLQHDTASEEGSLLLQVYASINEPDGFYGVRNSLNIHHRIRSLEHELDWGKALGAYDTLLQRKKGGVRNISPTVARNGLLSSMQQMGLLHVLDNYCRGAVSRAETDPTVRNHHTELQEFQFEAAWRTCKWDEQLSHQCINRGAPCGFHVSIFKCIQSLRAGDSDSFLRSLNAGRLSAIRELRAPSLESTKRVFSTLSKLQLYAVVHDAMQLNLRLSTSESERHTSILQWCDRTTRRTDAIRDHFALVEPVLAIQISILDALGCHSFIPELLVQLASYARKARQFPIAAAALLRSVDSDQGANIEAGLLEEARGLWAQGDCDNAVKLATYLTEKLADNSSSTSSLPNASFRSRQLRLDAQRLAGTWMASTRSESSDVITHQFLRPTINSADAMGDGRRCLKSKFLLASYSEHLLLCLIQTDGVRQQHIESQKDELKQWRRSKTDDDNCGLMTTLQKQLRADEKDYTCSNQRQKELADGAIANYVSCLQHLSPSVGKYDIRVVFKFVSLWFKMHERYPSVNAVIKMALDQNVFSLHKLIPLSYQLVSRLGPRKDTGSSPALQSVLQTIIYGMALQHPHHCLYQIFALWHGDHVPQSIRNSKGFVAQNSAKTEAAKLMITKLRHSHRNLVAQMTFLVDAYLELSEKPPSTDGSRRPVAPKLQKLYELPLVPVATIELVVEPSGNYDKVVRQCHIAGFDRELVFVGGINKPMKIGCFDADGRRHSQLLKAMNSKGGDDLRQDAVMEQVFAVANSLLRNNIETRRRALWIRTYKVIPMTPCVGMLQWCEDTIPLGKYLLGRQGAHARYRPNDISDAQARNRMRAFQESKQEVSRLPHDSSLAAYLDTASSGLLR